MVIDRVEPARGQESVWDYLAFYAQRLDSSVDGEAVDGNEGTFCGGWITSDVVGPLAGGVEAAAPCLERLAATGRIVDHLDVPHITFPTWSQVD